MAQQRRTFTVERRMRERGDLPGSGLTHSLADPVGTPAINAVAATSIPNAAALPDSMAEELRALTREIAELREQVDKAASSEFETDEAALRDIRIEIARMVREIGRAKSELASLKHPLSADDPVNTANLQLETIVSATEDATNSIMGATDEIEEMVGRAKAMAPGDTELQNLFDDMSNKLINIIEACSFQDLTGQRITKVIGTLRFIEQRVLAMIDIWGIEAFQAVPFEESEGQPPEGEELSGPAMEGEGLSQSDIDALFD
ncbi:MAG: protein phosphatase CheZ [Alphaproteobacteria bacterium]|nr:protein phosphatase CheZ [Alphaproteobacteria bacterium]